MIVCHSLPTYRIILALNPDLGLTGFQKTWLQIPFPHPQHDEKKPTFPSSGPFPHFRPSSGLTAGYPGGNFTVGKLESSFGLRLRADVPTASLTLEDGWTRNDHAVVLHKWVLQLSSFSSILLILLAWFREIDCGNGASIINMQKHVHVLIVVLASGSYHDL